MRSRRSTPYGLLALGLVAAAFFLLAPPQLGGSTIYTATVGDSMEPLFHKGDLALIRPASAYEVGDIVLYESPILHRPVLHRILVIQGAHYYFKGDHNHFVDPGYVTRDELLGKLWIHLPKVGKALSFVGKPAHASLFAAIAVLFLTLSGGKKARRRRERRGSPDWRPPVKKTALRRHFHRPRKSLDNILAGIALVLGALALLIGFATPLKHSAPDVGAYKQSGAFSYTARTSHSSTIYPGGLARTGQPIFLSVFKNISLAFSYRFASRFPHGVHGTIRLQALLASSSSTWRHTYLLEKAVPFDGDKAAVSSTVALQQLQALITELATTSGTVDTTYDITLQPIVHVSGVVDRKTITDIFAPTLPFTLTASTLQLNIAAPATLPGATYAPPSAATTLATGVNPTQVGSISGIAPNYLTFARYHLAVNVLRGFGLGLVGMALVFGFAKPFRRGDREIWSLENRVAASYGCVIVDVISLKLADALAVSPTELPSFENLASLARYLERPILHDRTGGVYATEDNGRLYIYRPAPKRELEPDGTSFERLEPAPLAAALPLVAAPRSSRRRRFMRPLALLVGLVIAFGLVTSFTAANTVPLTHAGVSVQARTVAELTPAQCAGIALSNLVTATGNTTTGTNGNDLILGKSGSGTFTLNGSGGSDCIVAGGGSGTTNHLDGGAGTGDVCIGALHANNTFANCEKTY